MSTSSSLFRAMRRRFTTAVIAGSAVTVFAGAQSAPSSAATQPVQPIFPVSSTAPAVLTPGADALFSSSASPDATEAASSAAQTNLASLEKGIALPGANAQYGRRRYGAPRYRGSNTNGDGSEKYTAFVGGGVTLPIGDSHRYTTPSWGFQVGAGRNFNKNYGLNIEFNWDEFGLQGNNLAQQSYVEDPLNVYGLQGNTDGYSHIWSLSVSPIYNLRQANNEGVGVYVTAGAGFYHKITTFTTPEQVTAFDPYYGIPFTYEANEPFDSYTSNAPGFDGGIGLTYKFSRFANERLYAEARYVVTLNSQRTGINGSNYNTFAPDYNYTSYNLYPANSNRSTYIPVKFGIRF